jgi:metallophosphoesterase (TIGR03767 family)
MIRAINAIEASPATGAPPQLLVSGGDNLDNRQRNELGWFLRLMQGGTLEPNSGGGRYEGVQAPDWPDPGYWHPDPVKDAFKTRLGFPTLPGLLDEAVRPFEAAGVGLPWISCHGNHDSLVLGAAIATAEFERVSTGGLKAQSSPAGFIPEHLAEFVHAPERFLGEPFRPVTPDEKRRGCGRSEFLEAHLKAGGGPSGHGFDARQDSDSRLYHVHDPTPEVRLIMLDTVNPRGGFEGSLDREQLLWLEQQLAGVRSDNQDRLVVVCSHHPLDLLGKGTERDDESSAPQRAVGAEEVEQLLHRHPNVVLWLSGDTHRNFIRSRPDPSGRTRGFWEVTTCSLIDWPRESRLVELVLNEDGSLSIYCTMIAIDASLPSTGGSGWPVDLAALSLEIAANDPHAGFDSGASGRAEDRTVELVLSSNQIRALSEAPS